MGAPNPLFTFAELEAAAQLVHRTMPPTPQYASPLLAKRTGCEVWVKHENHTPTCAFKVRGGVVYMDNLKRSRANVPGVISAIMASPSRFRPLGPAFRLRSTCLTATRQIRTRPCGGSERRSLNPAETSTRRAPNAIGARGSRICLLSRRSIEAQSRASLLSRSNYFGTSPTSTL